VLTGIGDTSIQCPGSESNFTRRNAALGKLTAGSWGDPSDCPLGYTPYGWHPTILKASPPRAMDLAASGLM